MRLDVCIPTLNSERTLPICLEAIKETLPYNRIIICDGFSSDKTVEIAEKFGCEIYFSKGKLGEVRNKLIKLAETEWFAFIDSDVVINKKWFNLLISSIDEKTGAINGFALPQNTFLTFARKSVLSLKLSLGLPQRGFTSNTLIRKSAAKGIKLPNLSRCEDIFLQRKIEERGWKWKFAKAFCIHLKPSLTIIKEAIKDLTSLYKSDKFALFKL